MEKRLPLVMICSVLALLVLLPAARGVASARALEPGISQSGTPEPAPPTDPSSTDPSSALTPTSPLEEIIMTRTPEPTATPGRIEVQVEELVETVGLARTTVLGLSVVNWVNLAISLLFVLAGYIIGTWLIRRVLPRAARRTPTEFDDRFLSAVGSQVRWLVVLIILYFGTNRLTFFSAGLKAFLSDAYFVMGLLLTALILIKLIDLASKWARERALAEGREGQLEPLVVLLTRLGRVFVVVLGLTALLSYFGVNVTAFAAALGLGGLSISLAAKDTIADAIAGFIVLVDQPYRIGDRIEIQELGTWGDVVDIGLRTTRIRTRDNRMVIVPNSVIGTNQVINYTYPDPRYRIETHMGIASDTDIEMVRQFIVDTVREVEGVLPDKPVDALYIEMGDSAMIFRVRWWLESYREKSRMLDKVHTALKHALNEAGIEYSEPTQTLSLQVGPQLIEQIIRALRTDAGAGAE
jgi:MscS family membrane protein